MTHMPTGTIARNHKATRGVPPRANRAIRQREYAQKQDNARVAANNQPIDLTSQAISQEHGGKAKHKRGQETSGERYRALMRSAHRLYRTSVSAFTRVTYSTGEKLWITVTEAIGTDPYMRTKNEAWLTGKMIFSKTSITWEETCVLAFLAATREPPSALTPKAAFNYLSAARKFLQNGGVDTAFLENSQYIRNTKASMQIAYRLTTGITDKDPLRLPVSADMIIGHHRAVKLGVTYTLVDLAVYTAEVLAYTTLARVSEYLHTGARSAHTLLSDDIMFELTDGAIRPAYDIASYNFDKVVGCLVNIRSAKNDATGRGHRYYFEKSAPGDNSLYCIVWTLWRYSQLARPAARRSFFYIPEIHWTLKPAYLNQRLKAMARMYGLEENRVSSHSLRIGGATALAAAGLHEYEIKQMGGWKSDVFLEYARNTTEMFARARTALARKNSAALQNTKRLHPGCHPLRRAVKPARAHN